MLQKRTSAWNWPWPIGAGESRPRHRRRRSVAHAHRKCRISAGNHLRRHLNLQGYGACRGRDPESLYGGVDALWELDVFGGQRRNVESATANVQAAVENISNVQVTIAAEVALDYVQLRGYQQQIAIARKNLIAMQNTALITRQKMGAGFASALDVANAEASVATTEAQIPVFETSARQSIYALSILLARPPADLLKELSPTAASPAYRPIFPGAPVRTAAPPSRHPPGRGPIARRHGADRGRHRDLFPSLL